MVDTSFVEDWMGHLDNRIMKKVKEITPKAVKEVRRGRIGQKRQKEI